MLQLIPGWVSYRRTRQRDRARKRGSSYDQSRRHLKFESLEERCVLAGGLIPLTVQNSLATNLAKSVKDALAPTANMPIIGDALADNPNFIKNQIAALVDDLDTASVTGHVQVVPGIPTTSFKVDRLIESHGSWDVPIKVGAGVLDFIDPDPNNPGANSHADVRVYLEIYFRLEFTIDTLTGVTTFSDAPISGLKDQLYTQQGGTLFNGGPLTVDAPDSPLAIVVSAFTQTDFAASGSLEGAFDATIHDVFWQKVNASQPYSIADRTWMTATVDVSMGNWSTGLTGAVIVPPVNTAHINGEAHANLELQLAMSDPLDFKVTTRMDADWTFDNVLLTPGLTLSQLGTMPYVDFLDVTVDLDSTLRTLGNILNSIQYVTNNPATSTYMAVMDTKLPIIGKSIFEIANAMGAIHGGWGDAISTIKYINSLHIAGQQTHGTINLGSFRIADPRAGGPIVITQTQLGNGAPQAVDNFFNYAFGINFPNENYTQGLHFWFLEDPMNVLFPAMMGKDRTLVTFTMPALDFTFNLDDVFDSFGDFELFPGAEYAAGALLNGEMHVRLDVDMGYDTAGLRRQELDQSSDKDDAKYGLYINAKDTYFEISAGMVLSAGVANVTVDGGLFAGIEVIPVGYLDAADPNRVRPGHLLRDAWKMVQGYGDFYANAHFNYPTGSTTLVDHVSIMNTDVFGFDTETHSIPLGGVITVTKTNTSEKIFVLDQKIDPSTERPVYGTPDEYEQVIAVLTDDVTDYYKIAKFVKQPGGAYTRTNYGSVNLIVVVGPTYGANYKDIHKTIIVDDVDGGANPVNAVILGGNGIDTLLYYGSGTAVIVGGDENDTIRAMPLTGPSGPSLVVVDYVDAANPLTNPLGLPQGRMDEILWAATPLPPAGPPGEDDDPPPPDPGGSIVKVPDNARVIKVDRPDLPPPGSGAGSGQSESGSAPGSSLENESIAFIEMLSSGAAGAPGFVSGSSYRLILRAAIGTTGATGNLNVSAVSTANGAALHAEGSQTNVTAVGASLFIIHSFGGDLHFGDLSTLPNLNVVVANQPLSAGTSTVFDGPSSGAAQVDISHDDNTFGQLLVTGALAYASVQFVGLSYRDKLRVKNAGGTVSVDDLTGAGLGSLTIDNSGRPGGSTTAADITINNSAPSLWFLPDADPNTVRLASINEPDILLVDRRMIDTLNLNLTGTTEHSAFIDASTMKGDFNILATGAATAKNDITLAKAGTAVDVSVNGGDANTILYFGQNRLSDIRSDVTASNLQLHVDNVGATDARAMTFTPTTFTGWDAGGLPPTLHYSNLRGVLTVDAGGGDRYNLAGSPTGITSAVFNSDTDVRSSLYGVTWAAPLRINSDWRVYLGQRILSNGTVERVKLLSGLSNLNVRFDFHSVSAVPTEFVMDGDLHAPGTVYTIDGSMPADLLPTGLHAKNVTLGIDVAIRGYSTEDDLYIYLPGGTVNADLTKTGAGSIHIDGRARLVGTNPTSPNVINVLARAGSATMTPLGTYDSLLTVYNPVYIYGSMPQDALSVTQPTEFKMASTLTGTSQIRFDYSLSGQSGFTVTSPTARYTVHSTIAQVPVDPLNPNGPKVATPISPITAFVDRAIMYTDLTESPLEAQKIAIHGNTIPWNFVVNGVVVTIPVEVIVNLQIYQPNPNPIATDNNVNIDASQLRGTFGFQVSEPDYTYAELLADGLLRGGAPPATNFSQTYVTISKTNPQLTTTITGTTQTNAFHYDRLVRFTSGGTVSRWAGMQVTAGTGDLGTLQGDLTVNQAWLKEVDNRNAALANIIQLTTAGVSWDAGDGGRTSLTLTNLQGKLTVTGNPLDRFAVEGTPNSAYRTVLHNFSTAATPSGVYVMGKNVMPLEVSGNFDLAVGRRLNLDGTVTNVGTILGAIDDTKNYVYTGGQAFLFGNFPGVWQDFELRPVTSAITGPITWDNSGYLTSYVGSGQPKPPLPIYYNYSGPGQGTFVFDASNETVTDRVLGDTIVQPGGASLNGISSNSNYAGQADFRFYESEVIYGPNTNVNWYGAKIRTNTNAFDVMAPTLLNNLLNGTVRYFANPANVGQTPIEQILIGATLGPVFVEGSGRNTRVEINPLFSLPTSLAMGIFDQSINTQSFAIGSHPGWGAAHTGGYSLIETMQANVSVSGAALRVIADIPRPVGSSPITSRPNVTIGSSSITGIGTGTISYSNLADSVNVSQFTFSSQLDLNPLNFPGLNVQLPAHFPVNTTVQNTPSSATTHISTVLSSANNTYTDGALNVLATTGKLILGDMYGVTPTFGDKFNWPGLAGTISTSWSDGISVSSIDIGNNGSLAGIQGAILLKGDSHNTTTTVTNIDGRNDAARSNVVFTRPDYFSNPFPTQFAPYQQVDGLASAPIYFGQFYTQTHPLNIYGSAGSTYDVASGPVNMKLYAGAGSNTTLRGTPLTLVGGSTVTTLIPYGLQLPNFTGVPEIHVEQDPANPAPTSIIAELASGATPSNFVLESTGGGMMRLVDRLVNDYYRLNYKGSDATVSINQGNIIIADTGSLGTTASSKANQVNVFGTTGLLKILPVGSQTANANITLGNNGNMQAILGGVEITQGSGNGSFNASNANDTVSRTITMGQTAGVFTVAGMSPGLIKFFGTGSAFLTGGSGGSTFVLDNIPVFQSFLFLTGGSSSNDTVVGPNTTNTWNLNNQNSTQLNSKVAMTSVENLRGGSGDDTFRFQFISFNNSNGSLTGSLDGGAGTDTLTYDFSSYWHNVAYNLSQGTAPLVAGVTSSIERAPFDLLSPGNKTNAVGGPIAPITMTKFGGPVNVTWSATNLPTGLSINAQTGVISGTIAVQASGNRTVQVNATDGTYSSGTTFTWTLTGPSITNPGAQTNFINDTVSLALSTQGGGTLTYSTSNLPAGLSINTATGLITGTIAVQVGGPRQVTVSVSNGFNTAPTTFSWDIPFHSLTTPSNQTTAVGNAVTPLAIVATNVHAPLTYYAVGLPNGVTIDATTGVISGTVINQAGAVGPHAITVHATDGFNDRTATFTWTVTGFGLLDPGTIVSASGATISRQIGSVGEPANAIYSVTGLPVGLSMDQHGLITGTIDPANALTGLFHVHVSATNGTVSADVNFDWRVVGFAVDDVADQFVPEGLPIAIQFPITNLQNENLTFTVSGLPGNFEVDSHGVLRGMFDMNAPTVGNVIYNATVTASNGVATDTATVKITTYDGYSTYNLSDHRSYAGSDVNEYIQVFSYYGHAITVTMTGLPEGLTFDGADYIRGTISESIASTTPHQVTVQVTNNTLNATKPTEPPHTYSFSFDWTVLRIPTAAELNAGTPSGAPQLVNVVDPSNSYPDEFHGVSVGSGASEHTVVYFTSAGKLWHVSNGVVSAVQSIDPEDPIRNPERIFVLSHNSLLLTADEGSSVWLVDEAGGQRLNLGSAYFSGTAVTIGDTNYLSVRGYNAATSQYEDSIISIHFDGNGEVTVDSVPNSFGLQIKAAFAGGVLATTDNPEGTQSLRWFNPTTGENRLLDVSGQYGSFDVVGVAAGSGGTSTAFINEYSYQTGSYRIRAISSTSLQSATPTLVSFPYVSDSALQGYPLLVGDKLVYAFYEFTETDTIVNFSVTDGTLAGTTTYTTPLVSNSASDRVSYMTAMGTGMYFVFTPNYTIESLSPETVVNQIWKLDTLTGALTNIADFRGQEHVYRGPTELTVGDGRLYFASWNQEISGSSLWSYDPANGVHAVKSYENNPYSDPESLAFIDDSLYFRAACEMALNLNYNGPSYQAWVIPPAAVAPQLPGDFNLDNTVDAGDYVLLRKKNAPAADYNLWRTNFGSSLQAPNLPGDFNHDVIVDAGDYVVWRKLGMNASEYDSWRQDFGHTAQTGGGAALTSSSLPEKLVDQAGFRTEALLVQEVPLAASRTENDPLVVGVSLSSRPSRSVATDIDWNSLMPNAHLGTTSAARSPMAVPIASDATHRDELLALCQAKCATNEQFETPTIFDVKCNTDDAYSDDLDDLDIHAIDDAFDDL